VITLASCIRSNGVHFFHEKKERKLEGKIKDLKKEFVHERK